MTTGTLQQRVYLQGLPVGERALIVGAEHVSFSAIMTLAHGGARAIGLTTTHPRHQSLAAFRLGAQLRYRVPVWTRTKVSAIHGRPRVEAVELTDLASGRRRELACDTVVFSDDWVPDNELAAMAGLELGEAGSPWVDAGLRSSRAGVFAAGNLLHGAEQADVAALSGRHSAAAVAGYLETGEWPLERVPIVCEQPLHWIAPQVVSASDERPPRGRFLLRSREFVRAPRIELRQGRRVLWAGRPRVVMPGRSAGLPADWATSVDLAGEPVVCRLRTPG
jgi:hypothetical protein